MKLSDFIPVMQYGLESPYCKITFTLLGGSEPRLLANIPDVGCKVVAYSDKESFYKEEAKIWRPIVASLQCSAYLENMHKTYGELMNRFPNYAFDGFSAIGYEKWRLWGKTSPVIEGEKC